MILDANADSHILVVAMKIIMLIVVTLSVAFKPTILSVVTPKQQGKLIYTFLFNSAKIS
jgi:hypothetical protein